MAKKKEFTPAERANLMRSYTSLKSSGLSLRKIEEIIEMLQKTGEVQEEIQAIEGFDKYFSEISDEEIVAKRNDLPDGIKKRVSKMKRDHYDVLLPSTKRKIETLYFKDEYDLTKFETYYKLLKIYNEKQNNELLPPVFELKDYLFSLQVDNVTGKTLKEMLQLIKGDTFSSLTMNQRLFLWQLFKNYSVFNRIKATNGKISRTFGSNQAYAFNAINERGIGVAEPSKKLNYQTLVNYANYIDEMVYHESEINDWINADGPAETESVPECIKSLARKYNLSHIYEFDEYHDEFFNGSAVLSHYSKGTEYSQIVAINPHVFPLWKEMVERSVKKAIADAQIKQSLFNLIDKFDALQVIDILKGRFGLTERMKGSFDWLKSPSKNNHDRLEIEKWVLNSKKTDTIEIDEFIRMMTDFIMNQVKDKEKPQAQKASIEDIFGLD
ncbi:MAG: hypothetical protein IJ538_03975 [Clostridia bacterium]|nr:hypothetical protein [Clostridia bacterium]